MSEAIITQFPVPQVRTATRLRMTQRGRRVLIALIVIPIVVGGFFAALNGGGADATNTAVADNSVYVTVHQGESLWQIAETVAPKADPRDVIIELTNYNHITEDVKAGQRIAIPAQYR